LFRLGLVGRDSARYGGLAYGNVSCRAPNGGFFISGSQTGGKACLDARHYCRVSACDVTANWLRAEGPIRPSSEALSHAAAYRARMDAGCVLHVHAPELWAAAAALGVPVTDPAIAYGTPAMADAIANLLTLGGPDVIAMGGHEDGLLAVGETVEAAAAALMGRFRQALLRNRVEPGPTVEGRMEPGGH
jgi:hypothetical protein